MCSEKCPYSPHAESMEGAMEFNSDSFPVISCAKVVEGH